MANIKFSQFTVETAKADVDFLVGYSGPDNVQISPTNLLADYPTGSGAAGQVAFFSAASTITGTNNLFFDSATISLGVGVSNPPKNFTVAWSSADTNVDGGNGLSGGTVGRGLLIRNNDATLNTYANLDFRANSADGRIAYTHNGTNDGDFHFITDNFNNTGTRLFIGNSGNVGIGTTSPSEKLSLPDNAKIGLGNSADLQIQHNGADSFIEENTGNLNIANYANDKDIRFFCDDGSGGITTYFQLDGGQSQTRVFKNIKFEDDVKAFFGTSDDLQIYHDGSSSQIDNYTGNLLIKQRANDADISFQCDDGSGSLAEYFRVDGSSEKIVYSRNQWLTDGVRAVFGSSDDLQMFHNATNSYIENNTGDLLLVNYANDKDIQFYSDDGSGGTTEYFRLDGSNTNMNASKTIVFNDDVKASFGDSEDLKILHNGTDSVIINERGNLEIQQRKDDGDIIFKNDDGGGGLITYFLLDGSLAAGSVPVTRFPDNSKLGFGDSTDLQIYHDGGNSYIKDAGTGILYIQADNQLRLDCATTGEKFARFYKDGKAELFYNNVSTFETTSAGVKISGVSEYADNTAAIAGGLTTGDVYRTGDLLKIVH